MAFGLDTQVEGVDRIHKEQNRNAENLHKGDTEHSHRSTLR